MKKENILKHLTILQNIILIIFPYILSKRGNHSRKTVILFLIFLTIIFLVVNGRKIIIDKKILLFALCYILFIMISFFRLGNTYYGYQIKICQQSIGAIILGFCITQIDIEERVFKYILPALSIFSFFPIYRGISEWSKSNFSVNVRILGDNWPTVFSVELGILLIVSMIVLFYEKKKLFKILAFFSIILGYIVILGTQTRIMILVIPFIFILISIIRNYKLGLCIILVFFLILGGLLTSDFNKYFRRFDNSSNDGNYSNIIRVLTFKRSVEMIKESKFLGIGFYNFQNNSVRLSPNYKKYVFYKEDDNYVDPSLPGNKDTLKIFAYTNGHSHNNFLEVLLSQGIFGFLSYVLFIFFIFKKLLKNYMNKEFHSYIAFFTLGIALIIYVLLNGIVEANIYMTKVNQMLFFILGFSLNKKFNIQK